VSAQENKAIARRLLEEPWTNIDVADDLVDDRYVGHDPSLAQPPRGVQGFKDNVSMFRAGYSDAQITVDDQIAEADKVASRWTGRGTHDGELMGIAPTGKQVTVAGLTISRVENGRVVEEWTNWDTLGMLQQLGAVPAPAQQPPA
jgi:predicted ester cyclase